MRPSLSVIVPTLNEASGIAIHLGALQAIRAEGGELIVADGGSSDGTVRIARPLVDHVIETQRGRGTQMNAGARAARGDILLFLHADTSLPSGATATMRAALADGSRIWGRFDVEISGQHPLLRVIGWCINRRSRCTGIATGDQAIFVRCEFFEAAGEFPEMELMEDIALSTRLKRLTPPICLPDRVATSGRRWEAAGVIRTMVLMWGLRFGYWLGCRPASLARWYG